MSKTNSKMREVRERLYLLPEKINTINADLRRLLHEVYELGLEGLQTDGAHHKQWYIEQMLLALGYDLEVAKTAGEWERGVAP